MEKGYEFALQAIRMRDRDISVSYQIIGDGGRDALILLATSWLGEFR